MPRTLIFRPQDTARSQGVVFEPDVTRAMGLAYERACRVLGLKDQADPATALVAEKIIELARRGESDPNALWLKAVGMLKGIDGV